ncbi:acyltransferase family protein [Blastococcus sp. SYSU D00813]
MPRPRTEIRALTGLRIVAAMWVVLFHFGGELVPLVQQVPGLAAIIGGGGIGVELFFVLSGFVIARSYLDECGRGWSTGRAARFVLNRFARVWPAFAVVTAAVCVWWFLAPRIGLDSEIVTRHQPFELSSLLRQLTMTHVWGEEHYLNTAYNPPAWSIGVEWTAYLAFPLLALVMRPFVRLYPAVNLVLAFVAMLPIAVPSYLYGRDIETPWELRIACSFVAGVLVHCAVSGVARSARSERWALRLTGSSLLFIVVVLLWAHWRSQQDALAGNPVGMYHMTVVVIWPLVVAGLSMTDRGLSRLLSSDTMVYGGRISYCLYLVHWPVQNVGLALVAPPAGAPTAPTPQAVLAAPFMIAVAVAVSAALHHAVEEPARRRLVRLWSGRRALEPVAVVAEPVETVAAEGGTAVDEATTRWHLSAAMVAAPASPENAIGVPAVTPRPRPAVAAARPSAGATPDRRLLPPVG